MQSYTGSRATIQIFEANDSGYRTIFNDSTLKVLADISFTSSPINGGTEILDDSISFAKLTSACVTAIEAAISPGTTLANDTYSVGRNNANSADVNMWKINTSDLLEHGAKIEELTLGHQKKLIVTSSASADLDVLYANSSDQIELLNTIYARHILFSADNTYNLGGASSTINSAYINNIYGQTAFPTRAFFHSVLSANQNNVTGSGSAYQIVCDTEVTDRTNNYNNSTGVFTAPVDGIYIISACVIVDDNSVTGNTTSSWAYVRHTISGGGGNRDYKIGQSHPLNGGSGLFEIDGFSGAVVIDMSENDTVSLYAQSTGTGGSIDVLGGTSPYQTYFSGGLLG